MSRQSLVSRRLTVRRVTATVLTILLLIQTTGCISWQPQTNPIPRLRNAKPTDTFRITITGGQVFLLTQVRIHGDSIVGIAGPPTVTIGKRQYAAVTSLALSEVRAVERRSDATLGVLVVTVIGIAAMALAVGNPMDNWGGFRW